jgi:uncharacterized protein
MTTELWNGEPTTEKTLMKIIRPLVVLVAVVVALLAAPSAPPAVEWKMLRGLNYKTGGKTPELKEIDGKVVKIPGYMVPLEDDSDNITEFLLVPYQGACVHTPPPPPNQIVEVKMAGGKKAKFDFWNPVWVHGKLEIQTVKSPYGDVSYKLTGLAIEPYKD